MPKTNDIYSKRRKGKDKAKNSRNRGGKYSSRSIRIKTQEMMNHNTKNNTTKKS